MQLRFGEAATKCFLRESENSNNPAHARTLNGSGGL